TKVDIIADDLLFAGMGKEVEVGRYHSWIVNNKTLPDCLEVTAVDKHGQIMAMHHKEYDVRGVQFHPESVLTPEGLKMLKNWIEA
ncbi:MAG: gamma-glutamyl-gamma-aminobutyrate hydrolase family protein, partial [Bacteroidota bacterium]|nr:gamma-glutamyl-gamma-aminobutyrate hydrolase family protein [Bacteroidota bacterium]